MSPPLDNPPASDRAASSTLDLVEIPRRVNSPFNQVARRLGLALALVVFIALVVRIGRSGWVDVTEDPIGMIDALYYASVTVTTTGYGDITAVSTGARLATMLLITPARILFLILVVGTTVEVLTDQSRQLLLTRRWRKNVKDHYIICGFGSTGQAVARDLISRGVSVKDMVAVDIEPDSMAQAAEMGIVAVHGNAGQRAVLRQAGIETAGTAIVVPNRDDTAVLIVLTAREMNPGIHIVAGGREQENLHILRQGGADEVVDATANLGRMLGLAASAPDAVHVVDDLLDVSAGLQLVEIGPERVDGTLIVPTGATLVAIVRDGQRINVGDVDTDALRTGDRLLVLREAD